MVIFFLWFGLICCGIVNGLIYDNIQAPKNYYYLGIVAFVASILLTLHWFYTKKWCSSVEDIRYPVIFKGSAIVSFIVGVSSLFAVHIGEVSWGFPFGCFSMFVLFLIASIRENSYS